LLTPPWRRAAARVSTPLALLGLLAMLVTPMAWALSTVIVRPNVAAPAANVAVLGVLTPEADASPAPTRSKGRRLVEFLDANRNTERFLLAMPNAMQAAPFIVRTGKSVMAMGGYLGRDPILAPADLERMATAGELRFVILGGFALVAPDTPQEQALAEWIRAHGRSVDSALWREPADATRLVSDRQRWASVAIQLYDLRPDEEPYQAARPR
jgi:4-amino-4-deoxy-L-arabinose transferase-like glycosyltransferase